MNTASALVARLLGEMTWDEKIAQLQIVFRPDPEVLRASVRSGIGAIFWPRSAEACNELQRVAREETRLGIPLLIGLDVIHGQFTIGPVPIAMGASFDVVAVEAAARLAAREASSGGVNWTFSPMIDVSRDPRWGRVVEGFGEDPLVNGVMGAAMIRGYQGDDLSDRESIAATAKHYVGYGHAEGGRDYNTADISENRLRNIYLEPFRSAVDAGVASVMASFNTIGGRPVHANRRLLTEILKEEWGFDGVVVGDADGVPNLLAHGVVANVHDAAVAALSAGLDVEMGGNLSTDDGRPLLSPSDIAVDRVDDAVRRMLELKEALGLFADSTVPVDAEITDSTSDARSLVRSLAARSMVVLTNDGVLPLAPRGRVLLTGPYAESLDHLGAWSQFFGSPATSLADELRTRYPEVDFTVITGTGFLDGDGSGIPAAVSAARDHDLILAFVGEPSAISGEAASRSDLRLPGAQEQLLLALSGTGVPLVVTLENGRPLDISSWVNGPSAVLEAWHPGTEGAAAIVDALTGVTDPAGRLPVTFPRSVGQVPLFYAHENTGRPATTGGILEAEHVDVGLHGPDNVVEKYTSKYLDLDLGPLFEFGHGGGYAAFEHSAPRLSRSTLTLSSSPDDTARVDVDVTNTSSRGGDEVVFLFIRDVIASIAQPVRRLVGFERRSIEAGSSATFSFEIGSRDLGYWNTESAAPSFVVEPGRFELHVGGSLRNTQLLELDVT